MSDTTGKPGWRYAPAGKVGSSFLVQLADATAAEFRRLGIPLEADNRLEAAAKVIAGSQEQRLKVSPDDAATNGLIGEAIRNVWDFYTIARTLPRERDADLNGKLKVMVRGAPMPDQDRSSMPRDFQFEQVVGAVFAMAGVPSRPAEPDLRFEFEGREWGVAIKRVRSLKRLADRITEGRKQLERAGLRGFVAVNVDAFLEGVPFDGTASEVGSHFDRAIERLHRLMPDLAQQKSLLGVMAMGRVVGWDFSGALPRVHHPWIFRASLFVDDSQDAAMTARLFKQLEEGSNARMKEWLEGLRPRE